MIARRKLYPPGARVKDVNTGRTGVVQIYEAPYADLMPVKLDGSGATRIYSMLELELVSPAVIEAPAPVKRSKMPRKPPKQAGT